VPGAEADNISSESQLKDWLVQLKNDPERQSVKDLANHYLYLDNKLVETYCNPDGEGDFTNKERPEVLDEEEFMHFSRQLVQELEYLLVLPFVKFWAEVVKDTQVIDFLDAFLFNMRKRNDIYKLHQGAV